MGTTDNLRSIINRQKEVLSELEAECKAFEHNDLVKENAELKAALEKSGTNYEKAINNVERLTRENSSLKNALYEQIYNEKVKIINSTAQKLDIYFRSNIDGELNKLTAFENGAKMRINNIREILMQNNIDAQDDIYAKLDGLSVLLNQKVAQARANAAQTLGDFSQRERGGLEALKNERLTEEQIREAAKKNNIERFVGLNVLNAIGIFLLIIGVITVARYTYVRLTDLLKGIMMFSLGGVMLAAGELLNRKQSNIFSKSISAGGVAILYVALSMSYFGLHILGIYPAIILCLLITAGALILSNRHNSQAIAAFALIGGYLPMFSIGSSPAVMYGAMVYFVALNFLALLISFNKKWRISSFIGLFLNIIGTVFICWNFYNSEGSLKKLLAISYVMFAFLVYTYIPLISTYRTKVKLRFSDVVLLAINTFFSSLIMYGVFHSFHLQKYNGLLAIAFAIVYLLLGRFVEKKHLGEQPYTKALFYLTGLTFVVLLIPLQFGKVWLSLGWLIEGVLLAAYGILNNRKALKRAGFMISLLCLCAFVLFDFTGSEHHLHHLFAYKYLAITLGSLIILGAYMYKKIMTAHFIRIYKYFALSNLWIYILYIIGKLGDNLYKIYNTQTTYHIGYLIVASSITATFILAYIILRIKLLSDLGTRILSTVMYSIGILALFILNTFIKPISYPYLQAGAPQNGMPLIGTPILVILGLLSVLAIRDLIKIKLTDHKLGIEWHPLIISGYFVIILTQNLITQYDLSFSNAAISIIYVLTALAWIVFGFIRRYSFMRLFGLALAILSVIKLFLIDLHGLTQGYRIISYFVLGITLIIISFVYQYFNKRLELKEQIPSNPEKDN